MADAALAAWHLLGDESYLAIFRRCHGWFHGQNSLSSRSSTSAAAPAATACRRPA